MKWTGPLLNLALLLLAACVDPAAMSRWEPFGLTAEQATVAAAAEVHLPQGYSWKIVKVEDAGDEWFVNFRPEPPPPGWACFGCEGAKIWLTKPGLELESMSIDQ